MGNRPMRDHMDSRDRMGNRFEARMAQPRIGVFPASSLSLATTADGLLAVLWRSRWIVALCIVASLGFGLLYIQTATPLYTSTARLYLDYTALRISSPYDASGRPQTDKYLYTQAEIVKSMPNITATIDTLFPQRLRTFADIDIPSAYLQKHIVVDVGRRDEIISVAFSSPYPLEAAAIVNCVVDTYMASRFERDKKSSGEVLKILQNDMILTTKELEAKRNELVTFQKMHMPLSLGSDQSGGFMQSLLLLENQLTQARMRRIEADAFLKGIQALTEDPAALQQYLQTKGNSSYRSDVSLDLTPLENRVVELELQEEMLLQRFTHDHPRLADLDTERTQIESKQEDLNRRFVAAVLSTAAQQCEDAKRAEEEIAALYAEQQEVVKNANTEIVQYQRLRSEVDRLTTYFETLDEQIREIRKIVGEDVGRLRMAVLEQAVAADEPSEPQKGKLMAVALICGVLLGGSVAVGRDWLDQTLRSADEISALLRVAVLGAVPAMSRRQKLQERGQKVLLQPDSHEAEAFRTIRTAVLFGAPKEKARTMLVTSPAAGDGKSTLVSNLAIAMACAGQKTLILDADFRKPTQHLIFELDHEQRCLSEVLAGRLQLAAAIQSTGTKGLHVLPCGHAILNPAEVLNGQRFGRLLECLTSAYDRVLIDAPPVTIVTDAQILGALSDITVLVVKANKSTRRVTQRALDALQTVGAHLIGVVINDVQRSGDHYGYYFGQYQQYGGSGSGNGRANKTGRGVTTSLPSRGLPLQATSEETKS